MKYILSAFIGFCVCLLLTGFFITQFWPRATLGEPIKVIENPVGDQPGDHPATVSAQGVGNLSGSVSLPQNQQNHGQNESDKTPGLVLREGEKLPIPVHGEIKTMYFNSRTGEQIGSGVHQISGETTLTVGANSIQIETIFKNEYRLTVEVPEYRPPPVYYSLGVSGGQVVKPNIEFGLRIKKLFGQSYLAAGIKYDGQGWLTVGLRN